MQPVQLKLYSLNGITIHILTGDLCVVPDVRLGIRNSRYNAVCKGLHFFNDHSLQRDKCGVAWVNLYLIKLFLYIDCSGFQDEYCILYLILQYPIRHIAPH